jgi:hypothetical protein
MSSANRQRLYRERQKCGLRMIPTPIDADMIQRLLDLGYLHPEDLNDRNAIGEALAEFAEQEAFRARAASAARNALVDQAVYHLAAEDDEEPTGYAK